MRVLILSRRRTLYSTRRLVETARQMGHRALVIDPLNCFIVCGQPAPSVYHKNSHRRLDEVDIVLPRIGASVTEYGLAVVRQFSILGIPIVNNSIPIARSRDKLRSLQLLAQHRIDIPRTVMARSPSQVARALEAVGGPPAIVKLIQGSQGVGVMLAETLPQLEAILDTLWGLGQNILIQEFIAESRGRDIRALVVGGRVVGAMRRIARLGEFRSNIHRGGAGRIIELSDEYRHVAVRAAEVMGLQVAGVDMLESSSGPKVIEINSSPGFEGLEQATRRDIAREILDYAVAYAASRPGRGARERAASARRRSGGAGAGTPVPPANAESRTEDEPARVGRGTRRRGASTRRDPS
jgi:ribosomal protein S6--L-glutamate ligase